MGLVTPSPNLAASTRTLVPHQLATQGTPRDLGESISPRKGPQIGTPSAPRPMGSRGKLGSPDFPIGECNDGTPKGGRDTGGFGGGDPPQAPATIGGSKEPRSMGMGGGRGGTALKIRVLGPKFPSSSLARTPMSYEKQWKTVGDSSGSESPQGLSPNSHLHRPP